MRKIYNFTVFALLILTQQAYSQSWWAQNSKTQSDLNEIFYVNDNVGWSFGDSLDVLGGFATGIVLKSTKKGAPWYQQNMGTPVYQIEGSYFFSTSKGIAVGRNKLSGNGAIVTTSDGGVNWTAYAPQPERLVDVRFVNSNVGWAVGRNDFALRTVDGGVTWKDISASTGNHLNGVFFTTPSNGYVVGRSGNIIYSVDSGTTWIAQTSGVTKDLNAVSFVNDSTGWVVGRSGTILYTNNYGNTWTQQTSGTVEELLDVDFVNATTGWAVGKVGTVLKTTDSGVNWLPDSISTTEDITSISMRNTTLGWICGTKGVVYIYAVTEPVGIAEILKKETIALYPNPAKEYFNIALAQQQNNVRLQLFDITGSLIYAENFENTKRIIINKGNIKSGLYFVKLTLADGRTIQQRVIFN